MIAYAVEPGSVEWMNLRLGLPTASQFDRLLTPKTWKPSASRVRYRAELLTEWLIGQPLDWGSNNWMERGSGLEAEARSYYALQTDAEVLSGGFVTREDGQVGGSPDGLIDPDGGLEIKCPAALQHVQYLLGENLDYVGQVQGYMYLTGRDWWDVVSYNPMLPPVIRRVARDEPYIRELVPVLDELVEQLEIDKGRLAQYRVRSPARDFEPMTDEELGAFGIAIDEALGRGIIDQAFAVDARSAAFAGRWFTARTSWRAIQAARPPRLEIAR